jgi:hypothetical protein
MLPIKFTLALVTPLFIMEDLNGKSPAWYWPGIWGWTRYLGSSQHTHIELTDKNEIWV